MPSATAFGLPGRLTTRQDPITPASPREIAAIGVWRRPSARSNSDRPAAGRSIRVAVASGVTSLGPKPVPPVVMISSRR